MENKKSIGHIIRRIHSNEIAPVYSLFGNDAFLQDFFIKEVSQKFLDKEGIKIHFSLDDDSEGNLMSELFSYSLFEDKRVIVVRQTRKFKDRGKKELEKYLNSPNSSICLILIFDDFYRKTKFTNAISDNTTCLDVRPPFENKLKEWVNYIVRLKGINASLGVIDLLIELHGDSIANVVNELEKMSLSVEKDQLIDENIVNEFPSFKRSFQIWHFIDAIGKKDISLSTKIYKSLSNNGVQIPQLSINLTNIFQQMLWVKMGQVKGKKPFTLNKILWRNLRQYSENYYIEDIQLILRQIRKIDLLAKTTSLSDYSLMEPLIISICKGIYA